MVTTTYYNFLIKSIARNKTNKLFAIELHYQLLDIKLSNFNEKIVLKNKTKSKNVTFLIRVMTIYIYSCQINDINQKYIYANYRNIYDFNRYKNITV